LLPNLSETLTTGETDMNSKYTRNSLIHRAMQSLDRFPRSPEQLRTSLAHMSIARFNEAVTEPLWRDGLANNEGGMISLTKLGREKLSELGSVKEKLPSSHKTEIMNVQYDGAELRVKPVRSGAAHHEDLPSRIGGKLHHRDGRVECA
jgi:hypothetical protein